MKNITILILLMLSGFSSCKIMSHTNPGQGGADIFLDLHRQPNGNYSADLSLYDPSITMESIQNNSDFSLNLRHVSYNNNVQVAAIAPHSISPVFNGQKVKGGIEATLTTAVNPWPTTIGIIVITKK